MLVLTLCILVSLSIVTLSYFLFRSATILVHEYQRMKVITSKAITELHDLNSKLASDEFKKLTDIAAVIFPSSTGGETSEDAEQQGDDCDELKCDDGCGTGLDAGEVGDGTDAVGEDGAAAADEDIIGDISGDADATNADATNADTGDDAVIVSPPQTEDDANAGANTDNTTTAS